ncbi:MAG: D-alanyl-D-alanine carboxypeptidase [Hyphomicrobiales bacterium]|nr:D-alanyl-D-alanine carboxypeptidase [Hyphomicrobiales bacterium]
MSRFIEGRGPAVTAVLFLVAAVLGFVASDARAQQQGQGGADFTTKVRQAILMDATTGAVLFQARADELAPPASMSKLMTLAVLFRAIKRGEVKLTDEFLMSENAWRRGGAPSGTSAMFVPINTRASVDELIKGIIVQSGNDAAIAVAEAMAGTEEAFARRMMEEAQPIGLKASTFRNATGLSDPGQLMSVRELAILARHLIVEYPEHYAIFGQREFNYRRHKFINRNPLLGLVEGVDGLKTGFLKEAGYGLVASAKQGNRRLIAVVNGAATPEDRREEARRLLDWGFRSFSEFKIFDAGEIVGKARVYGGERWTVPLTGEGDVMVLLPRTPANPRLRADIIYNSPIKAPVSKGDRVAILRVKATNDATTEVPLYAAEDVPAAGRMRRGLDSLIHMAFGWMR